MPVITMVIHFGTDKWDGPLSLSEMMDVKNSEIMRYMQDYKIHLIDPVTLSELELSKFSTSLREVMACIKYAKDKESMRTFISESSRRMIETSAARVINVIIGTSIEISDEQEEIDMCEAWKGIMEDCRAEGRTEGVIEICAGLVRDGLLDIKIAAARANISEAELQAAINKMS